MQAYIDQAITWRRHLHQHPGLSFEEVKTSQFSVDEMSRRDACSIVIHHPRPGLDEHSFGIGLRMMVEGAANGARFGHSGQSRQAG